MSVSETSNRLRAIINKAIDDLTITSEEYDEIIEATFNDGHIDPQERALLSVLQKMIENNEIKFARKD